MKQAETAYFAWTQYWDEESPATLAQIERSFLMKSYEKGSFPALAALIRARDSEAALMLKTVVLSGGDRLAKSEYATAIRLIGERGDASLLNPLRMALYSEDKEIVYAAIEALGNLGDKRIIPELFTLFDSDNLERNVLVARALNKLGAGKQVRARFQPQLRFPMPGCANGQRCCWPPAGPRTAGRPWCR